MKVALVHYWLVNMAGGEKVLEALCRLYPQADIFTHVVDREKLLPEFRRHKINTTFINSLPASRRLYKKYLPLMPHALEQLDLTDYDLVISSESGPAKGVITRPDCLHVCYCHTPMRYLWDNWPAYMRSTGRLSRLAMRLLLPSLRQWDCLSAQRVDHFVANSRHVARRIRKYWRREAAVVHPPVDTNAFTPRAEPGGEHYLCFGRLASYKRVDLAVEVCTRLGRPLVVAGDGEMMQQLKAKAGPSCALWAARTMSPCASSWPAAGPCSSPARKTSASSRWKPCRPGSPSSLTDAVAPPRPWWTARPVCSSASRPRRAWPRPCNALSSAKGISIPDTCTRMRKSSLPRIS